MSDPIAAGCSTKYMPAYHSSGTRDPSEIKWIVMHDEEAPTAAGAAAYFQTPRSGGSAHLCVDDNHCFRCLPDRAVPWGAQGANEHGFHIEQAGYARWSAVVWFRHARTLRRAAYKAAFHCRKFDLPPDFVTATGLLLGHKGITTHAECSKAFGGTHTDPGPLWPRAAFMALVRKYHRQLAEAPR